jgi:hypothetical protein
MDSSEFFIKVSEGTANTVKGKLLLKSQEKECEHSEGR